MKKSLTPDRSANIKLQSVMHQLASFVIADLNSEALRQLLSLKSHGSESESGQIEMITNSIAEQLLESLVNIEPNELYTLLLYLISQSVKEQSAKSLRHQALTSPHIKPTQLTQIKILELDLAFINFFINHGYESVELPPVGIRGSNSITRTSQDKVLSTIRGLELIGDACVALAYHHIQKNPDRSSIMTTDYINSMRLFRNQYFAPESEYTNHFRMMSIGSNVISSNGEEQKTVIMNAIDKYIEHIHYFISALEEMRQKGLIKFDTISVALADIDAMNYLVSKDPRITEKQYQHSLEERSQIDVQARKGEATEETIGVEGIKNMLTGLNIGKNKAKRLCRGFPILEDLASKMKAETGYDISVDYKRLSGIGHYESFCYHIFLHLDGQKICIADGGITNWTDKLLYNDGTKFVVGGLGTEILLKKFGR